MLRFEDRIALLKSQHEQSLARAAHFNMRILSGVYKSRTVRKGGHDGELMTPEELLHEYIQLTGSWYHYSNAFWVSVPETEQGWKLNQARLAFWERHKANLIG